MIRKRGNNELDGSLATIQHRFRTIANHILHSGQYLSTEIDASNMSQYLKLCQQTYQCQ